MARLSELYKDKSKLNDELRRYMIDLNYSRSQLAHSIGIGIRSLNLLLDGGHDKVTDKVFSRVISYLGHHHDDDGVNNGKV